MAKRRPVGVFDSGVGGLSVWREIARQAPQEDLLYVADQAHVPYGNRRLREVREFSEAITQFLLDRGAKLVVVACNTASAAALHYLRRKFPDVPFVGMEPAVKPAVERSRSRVVGVIATQTTFQGELFTSLLERYTSDVEVLTQICPGLVEAVEAGSLETAETKALLRRCLSPLMEAQVDQLVLGCTHYPFLASAMKEIVGEGVSIIDPAPAVARQTRRVLARREEAAEGDRLGRRLFYTTGDAATFREIVERLLSPSQRKGRVIEIRWRESCFKQRLSSPRFGRSRLG